MKLNPTQVYDQKTKTAPGAQNPFYLRQAKKAQPALYDGDELLKPCHVPVTVSTSEEELELAEATRNKLHVKMNDFVCVENRVNITPPNYSKENFMATFTPQTQLTPEQVFWSLDLAKRKAEAKGQCNTPDCPTTCDCDFEKTCKKRITPTGITEGERGFEQTKRCYLTEVIPFFNLLKEHFEGIQKSLVTEVRAMKAVFENLEAEVDQNETDLRSGEIERKNLLITNENLVAECLSKDVFYTATDSVLNVSRFSDMHDAFTSAQKRVKGASTASRSNPRSNTKKDRTLPAKSALKQVEAHSRMNKSNEKHKNHVDSSISYKRTVLPTKQWKPTGRLLPLGRQCPLVRSTALKSDCLIVIYRTNLFALSVVQIVLWYLDSGYLKHMTGDRLRLRNFVKKFIGTVRFGNDHFGAIMGYGDYVIDLEVASRKHTCFVRDLDGVDLIKGSRGMNLYTISVEDMMRSSPVCLLSKLRTELNPGLWISPES
ncbi:hypothetical protein Tco_0161497 [Tanacetum coccineum]